MGNFVPATVLRREEFGGDWTVRLDNGEEGVVQTIAQREFEEGDRVYVWFGGPLIIGDAAPPDPEETSQE